MKNTVIAAFALACFAMSPAIAADTRDIGAVSTAFQLLGPNHKIAVSAFTDPSIDGITCYVARPRTGGIKGGLGLAEDPSYVSIACNQTGPIVYKKKIESDDEGEEVFDERRSILFKELKVDRLYDTVNGSLVYVARTTKLIDGSPKTSITVVTPRDWNGVVPTQPQLK